MVCIYCDAPTDITNSRPQKRLNRVWRRRHCSQCGAVFTTIEAPILSDALMIRTLAPKASLKPFWRDKLYVSIYNSLQHRKDALQDASGITDTVMSRLKAATEDGVVYRDQLVTLVDDVLQRFDTAAAVHYKAFHKD